MEQLEPLFIKERYLIKDKYVQTTRLVQSFYRSPGEMRPVKPEVLSRAIIDGVQKGIYGLGELEGENPHCIYFKERPDVSFGDNEILINEKICIQQQEEREKPVVTTGGQLPKTGDKIPEDRVKEPVIQKDQADQAVISQKFYENVTLSFNIPKGKVSDVMRIINYLQTQFESVQIVIDVKGGRISVQDYENKVLEALRQLGIEIKNQ